MNMSKQRYMVQLFIRPFVVHVTLQYEGISIFQKHASFFSSMRSLVMSCRKIEAPVRPGAPGDSGPAMKDRLETRDQMFIQARCTAAAASSC